MSPWMHIHTHSNWNLQLRYPRPTSAIFRNQRCHRGHHIFVLQHSQWKFRNSAPNFPIIQTLRLPMAQSTVEQHPANASMSMHREFQLIRLQFPMWTVPRRTLDAAASLHVLQKGTPLSTILTQLMDDCKETGHFIITHSTVERRIHLKMTSFHPWINHNIQTTTFIYSIKKIQSNHSHQWCSVHLFLIESLDWATKLIEICHAKSIIHVVVMLHISTRSPCLTRHQSMQFMEENSLTNSSK